ncbi:hypothetical protein D3C85_935770 [compost metagenome]
MVLVDQVVAVHDVLAGEIAETQEHPDRLVLAEHVDVLAPSLVFRNGHGNALDRPAEDAAFLEVDMHRVLPAAALVDQLPDLALALVDLGAGVEDVFRLAVDGPFATLAVEHPAAHLGPVDFLVAQRAQRPQHVGHLAEVLLRRVAVHQQLEHLGA